MTASGRLRPSVAGCLAVLGLLAAPASRAAGPDAAATNPAGPAHVASNSALSALAHTAYPAVVRDGFAAAGDAPPVAYWPSASACSLGVAGAGDGGSQVRSSDGGCWLALPIPDDPRDYGANPADADTGNVNETALSSAAAAQSAQPGCRVRFGPGRYKFSTGAIDLMHTCHVYGEGRDTWIDIAFAQGALLTLNGGPPGEPEIDHLLITHSIVRTGGADIVCNIVRCQVHDLYDGQVQPSSPRSYGPYVAVQLTANTTLSVLDNIECRNVTPLTVAAGGTCVLVGQAGGRTAPDSDILQNITCGLDQGSAAPTSCIEFKSGDANLLINPNLLQAQDNILIDPADGDGVLDTKITGGYVDSAARHGLHTAPTGRGNVTRIWADGTWFGDNGASGVYLDNLGTGQTKGFYCNACQIVLNASSGVTAATGKWSDIAISAGCMAQNAVGFAAAPGVNDVAIDGGQKIGICAGLDGSGMGVAIAGLSSNWQIQGVNFTGSRVAITGAAGLTRSRIEGNIGYNPVGPAAISVAASPFAYTAGPSPETVFIFGGVVSGVAQDGVTVCTVSPCSVQLDPFGTVVTAYSRAPTMNKVVH